MSSNNNGCERTGEGMFFVLSTGRSGSETIAKLLSQHPKLSCSHESRNQLIRLSTAYENGEISYESTLSELDMLYNWADVYTKGMLVGESHQKLSNLVKPLAELFPKAKFLWLIRDAKKVIASCTKRGWYSPDYVYHHTYRGANSEGWNEHRLQGDICGHLSSEEWNSMQPFEKNCWYWNYWNSVIKSSFLDLESDRTHVLKLEKIDNLAVQKELLEFLKVDSFALNNVHSNKARNYHNAHDGVWDKESESIFQKNCGALYREFYGTDGQRELSV